MAVTWTRWAISAAIAIAAGVGVALAALRYLGNLPCPDCDGEDYPYPCGTCGKGWGDAEPN